MKNKTTKELFDIATGSLHLCTDSKNAAVAELENRKLSLNDTAKIKSKIELESLIQQQKLRPDSADVSISLTTGIVTMVMTLIILFIEKSTIGMVIAAICFIAISILTIYNFFKFRKKKRVEFLRTVRIYELINEI
jgi:Flp pilus assembly protein TadB